MNALGGMRNACWCRLKVRHSVNGTPTEQPLWELEEYNKLPPLPTAPTGRTGRPICEDRTCRVGSQSSGDGRYAKPRSQIRTVGLD